MAGVEVLVISLNLPNLRFLQLANIALNERGLFNFLQKSKTFLGFPKLKFLSLRRSFIPQSTTPDVLSFFLKNAENIEAIDLQGCSCFNFADLLVGIGPLHRRQRLKSVDFSGTIAKNEDDFNRFFNVQGLDCAIEDLSLSGIKTKANAEDFYLPFINKFVLHADRLKNLDLGRTSIEKEEARLLLERKPHLHSLTLSGCYGIPRSWRKIIKTEEFSNAIRAFYE
ncbi:unnamed protein product [Oikopleura dioica]|uniref:Uncharacterized protein n=1 Tax=Oikopleura dioica TaxID=34765 RepID=E4XHI0_OIKDI|nr:unnamed protein product [Oikopleura dioica]